MFPRGVGKTRSLIEKSNKTGARIVTFTASGVSYVNMWAQRLGLTIPAPIPITDVDALKQCKGNVLLDDADYIVSQLFEEKFPTLNVIDISFPIEQIPSETMTAEELNQYYEARWLKLPLDKFECK